MKKINIYGILCGLFLLTLFVSCNDDDSPSYEKKNIDNPELLVALQKQGFTVNGKSLEVNAKVTEATKLNLSGSELKSLRGLEFFSKLVEVDLSNNDFGTTFDFAQLPAQVKKVNLSDNEIYDYKGLINVNFETANIQVLRKLDKLVLPYTARWNMEALPFYFKEKGAVANMQMQNKEGQSEEYNTLREVPDPITRKYIQDYFSSVMTEDGKIDISKKINTEQENTSIDIERNNVYNVFNKANNIDGIEFIVNSPFYKGTQIMIFGSENKYFNVPYLKPQKSLNTLLIYKLNLTYFDWTSSEGLRWVQMEDINNLKTVDLSYSKLFMQAPNGINQAYFYKTDFIGCRNVPELETIKIPDLKKPMPLSGIELKNLPKLQNLDMSKVSGIYYLTLLNLPMYNNIDLSSLNDAVDSQAGEVNTPNAEIEFSASERICNIPSVKDFIIRMGKKDRLWFRGKGYDYRHFYEDNTANRRHYLKQHSKGMYNSKDLLKKLSREIERQNSNK